MLTTVIVCADYSDILALTLPHNKKLLEEIIVITTAADLQTQQLCKQNSVRCHVTDVFTRDGAVFNKGAAINEVLQDLSEWVLSLDADVLVAPDFPSHRAALRSGRLYGCRRRALVKFKANTPTLFQHHLWKNIPVVQEKGPYGYFQLFHMEDPILRNASSLFPADWRFAGGCDNEFMLRWPEKLRTWLPCHVLHLGPMYQNWCGRATQLVSGKTPPRAAQNLSSLRAINTGKAPKRLSRGNS